MELISVLYRKVEPQCPEFKSFYNSMEQAVVIRFTALNVVFHKDAMLELKEFVEDLLQSASRLDSSDALETEPDLPPSGQQIPAPSMGGKSEDSGRATIPPSSTQGVIDTRNNIQFFMRAQLDYLSLTLCDSHNNIAEVFVRDLESGITMKHSRTTIRARLKDLSIEDSMSSNLYTKIICIEDATVFDVKFVILNRGDSVDTGLAMKDTSSTQLDYTLRLRMGRVQFVFLNKFVNDVMKFFEPFTNKEVIASATEASQGFVQKQVEDIQREGKKIGLNINIRAPVILVPQSSQSANTLIAHFGDLSIRNVYEEAKIPSGISVDHIPYVDKMLIELNAVQVSRAMIIENQAYGPRRLIIEPVSLHIEVKRALQPTIKEILLFDIKARLENIKVNLGEQDLATMLAITTHNLKEGQSEDTLTLPQQPFQIEARIESRDEGKLEVESIQTLKEDSGIEDELVDERPDVTSLSGNWKEIQVSFAMEGVDLELFTNEPRLDKNGAAGLQLRDNKHGLSQFMMHDVGVTACIFSDKAMEVKLTLASISLEDIRRNSPLAIKRMFQKLSQSTKKPAADEGGGSQVQTIKPMLDVTYKQYKNNDQSIDVAIEGIRLNVCTHYYLVVVQFFTSAMPTKKEDPLSETSTLPMSPTLPTPAAAPPVNHSLRVYATLKRPEIVLFAEPTSKDSHVLVLKSEAVFDYNSRNGQDDIAAGITNLHMVSCVYSMASKSTHRVLYPCNVTFTRTTSPSSGDVMSVTFTTLDLHISPTSVHIIKGIVDAVSTLNQSTPELPLPEEGDESENLWTPKAVTPDEYMRNLQVPEKDRDDIDLGLELADKIEKLTIAIPRVHVLIELEIAREHVPMMALDTVVEATLKNWSRYMQVTAELQLEMKYYNEKLDVWEPLIEPVMEKENVYRPWEMTIKVSKAPSRSINCTNTATPLGMDTLDGVLQPIPLPNVHEPSDSETDDDTDDDTDMDGDGRYSSSYFDSSEVGSPSDTEKQDEPLVKSDEDSDNEGVFDKITDFFGGMFSSDEESDEEDEPTVVQATDVIATIPVGDGDWEGGDEVDAEVCEELDSIATFIIINSLDMMQATLTPTAINIIKDVADAFTKSPELTLRHVEHKPAFRLVNTTGLKTKFLIHPNLLQVSPVLESATMEMRNIQVSNEVETKKPDEMDAVTLATTEDDIKGDSERYTHSLYVWAYIIAVQLC
uniref:Vacuolar protein sorting-associated protein 13C-like n=1 Tax=Saccoglossus kowalevskii TaxID=10224 RepID=A0ABM0M7I2_SACKO|nr:PREDICTED: vacuolar protein sorting-associated protein 13C-like [Saccoglossus kowalevskii]